MVTKSAGLLMTEVLGVIDPETEAGIVKAVEDLRTTLDLAGLGVVAVFIRGPGIIPEDPNDETKVIPRQALVPPGS